MPPKTKSTPAAGDELAQGTPGEPASPGVGALVVSGHRHGVLVGPGVVCWLPAAERCDLPLQAVTS